VLDFVSVSDAADSLNLSSARVRLLAANGGLPAAKVGGRWLVERSGLEQRRARGSRGGRRFSPVNAWAVLRLAASGEAVDPLDPATRSRLRRLLSLEGLEGLAPRLERRAEVRRYSGHPGEIAHLLADKRLVASGVSAARAIDLDLMSGREADGYISASALDAFVGEHALSPAAEAGAANVTLRVVSDDVWTGSLAGCVHAPEAAVALDLAEEADPRSRAAGEGLLDRIDRAAR
jgi:excisionase family DNA binding protein